jgi:hypothetical protein
MPLPTPGDALAQIHRLADEDKVEISRNAARDTDGLGYTHPDVCDVLFNLEEHECTCVGPGKHRPECPVITFVTVFQPEGRDDPDHLFVEVAINPDSLFVLACKLDGSPR